MNNKKVTVAGGGVLGSQIAFQSTFSGFDTTIWLRSEGSIGRSQPKIDRLYKIYLSEIETLRQNLGKPGLQVPGGFGVKAEDLTSEKLDELQEKVESAYKNLKLSLSLEDSAKGCDYYIESMAEIPDEKHEFYKKLDKVLDDNTIVMTNSSTFLPSTFKEDISKPERYLALHFANNIWRSNIGEVMGHSETSQAAYDEVVEFAKAINMVRAWKLGTGSPLGPFQILDIVGLTTAYNIVSSNPESKNPDSNAGKIAAMLKKYIDEGKTGINAGEGFYKYR